MSELIPQDTTQTTVDQVKNEDQTNIVTPVIPTETQEDPDWRAVREQRKADRKAREEAERRAAEKAAEAEAMKAAMEALLNKQSFNTQNHNYFNENEETEEQRIAKKVDEALRQREAKYKQEREEEERRSFPQRLRRDFSDFDKVCDPENLDYLEYHHPEIATPYKYMPEGYEKWSAIYKAAKKYVPNTETKREIARMNDNLSKPASISSPGTTQPASTGKPAHILTEQQKMRNWERMTERMKGIS